MSTSVFLMTLFMAFGTLLLICGMHYLAKSRQNRAQLASESGLRDIATKATAALAETASRLSQVQAELAGVGARLTELERMLREVG